MNAGHTAITALSAALVLTPLPASADADVPPPGSVSVALTTLSGSGCPQGTVMIDSRVESFTVRYSNYRAMAGVDQPPRSFRKSCSGGLKVSHPPEFTYGIMKVKQEGYGELQDGASGSMRSAFSHPGAPAGKGSEHVIQGPYFHNWQFIDQSDVPEVPVKPCDSPSTITLATEMRIDAGTSDNSKTSYMVLDDVDNDPGSTYHFYWKHC
nr:DUF4360 domain-containing protein [Actinomadura rubrisoli]